MDFLLQLKNMYDENKPIFLKDIKIKNLSNASIRQYISRLERSGEIKRYDKGIYYFPKKSILGILPLSFDDVIYCKYIYRNDKIIGFYSGLYFLNYIVLITQVPNTIEITANIEKSIKRVKEINGRKVILKKSKVAVSKDNYKILQFLDSFIKLDLKIVNENYAFFKQYIVSNNLTRDQLKILIPKYSRKVMKILIESGLIFDFI